MKTKSVKINARKGRNGEAAKPLSPDPTVSAAGTNNESAIPASTEPKTEITVQLKATGAKESVDVSLVVDREGRRACLLKALEAGMVLTSYSSERSQLAGTYATAAEARHAVGMIRAALAAAATQLA